MKRTVLVILSDRLNRLAKPRVFELDCDDSGQILAERKLRAMPRKPGYDEVWENDEGKTDVATCHRFKKHYGHALLKAK